MNKSSLALVLTMAITLSGCQQRDAITTYTLARTAESRPPVDYQAFAQQLDHTLVAIVPLGEKAWFFKMAGPAPAVQRRREDFLALVTTIAPAPTPDSAPTWTLPAGWEQKGPSEMRVATLIVPDDDGPLEIAISSLLMSDNWDDFLERNVTRWLRQLSQGPLSLATIKDLTQQVETQAGPAMVLHLAGTMAPSSRANPHASIASTPPSQPVSSSAQPASGGPLTFDVPAGWEPGRISSMRKAAFNIQAGDQRAELTVIDLPVTGGEQVSDVASNVRRWAVEVRLEPLDATDLEELVEARTIGGLDGHYVALLGPEAAEQALGTLAAMVIRKDKVWFFKLKGDRALVKRQAPAFLDFLDSVRFR